MSLNLPKWQSHKVVQAARIDWVGIRPDGHDGISIGLDNIINAETGEQAYVNLDPTTFVRYEPRIGDYYVLYEDGYASISPKKAFEEGYSPLAPSPQQAYADRLSQPRDDQPTTDGARG